MLVHPLERLLGPAAPRPTAPRPTAPRPAAAFRERGVSLQQRADDLCGLVGELDAPAHGRRV